MKLSSLNVALHWLCGCEISQAAMILPLVQGRSDHGMRVSPSEGQGSWVILSPTEFCYLMVSRHV